MKRREVWHHVDAARADLADLLSGLAPSEWAVHSLCPGWTVRDVAAHLSAPAGSRGSTASGALPPDRTGAVPVGERMVGELVADVRRSPARTRLHAGSQGLDALVEVLVHGQDIARPLGRELAVPPAAAAVAAERVWSAAPFYAEERFADLRFEAADAELVLGEGTVVTGTAMAVLLALTGRTASLGELTGHGIGLLNRRLVRS